MTAWWRSRHVDSRALEAAARRATTYIVRDGRGRVVAAR